MQAEVAAGKTEDKNSEGKMSFLDQDGRHLLTENETEILTFESFFEHPQKPYRYG